MAMRVLIIGGYGNLGSCIARQLVQEEDAQLIIAGRDLRQAETMAAMLNQLQLNQTHRVRAEHLDIDHGVSERLFEIKPMVVIHAAGPFRDQGYQVASACMEIGAHYIDLATDSGFVGGMVGLRNTADDKGVLLVSGATAKPCLVAAVIQQFQRKFAELQEVDYCHSKSLSSVRGTASVADLLGQAGAPVGILVDGEVKTVYGMQGFRWLLAKKAGLRILGNTTATQPGVFPQRFPTLTDCRLYEGVELKPLQLSLWLLSWLGRVEKLRHFEKAAPLLARVLGLLKRFDSAADIYTFCLTGRPAEPAGEDDEPLDEISIKLEIRCSKGDGVYIQCIPAILLTRKLLHGDISEAGVLSAAGLVTLKEYIDATSELNIAWKAGS